VFGAIVKAAALKTAATDPIAFSRQVDGFRLARNPRSIEGFNEE
jgi:hypothetical protein